MENRIAILEERVRSLEDKAESTRVLVYMLLGKLGRSGFDLDEYSRLSKLPAKERAKELFPQLMEGKNDESI